MMKNLLFLFLTVILSGFCFDGENWMKENQNCLKNKVMGDILLPGTHDSGALNVCRCVDECVIMLN